MKDTMTTKPKKTPPVDPDLLTSRIEMAPVDYVDNIKHDEAVMAVANERERINLLREAGGVHVEAADEAHRALCDHALRVIAYGHPNPVSIAVAALGV